MDAQNNRDTMYSDGHGARQNYRKTPAAFSIGEEQARLYKRDSLRCYGNCGVDGIRGDD